MIHKQNSQTWLVYGSFILVICILAGCAAKRPYWGDLETGLILQYRMAEDQVLKYQVSVEQTQNIEVMGQSMETETNSAIAFSVNSKGQKENNHQLGVTIDSMSINVTSPQGELSPDMSNVVGKSFDMTLSLFGEELDLSGAKSIQYDLGPAGKRSIASNFQAVFPDLADRPLKKGDTWISKDTITEEVAGGEIQINLESLNTLEGFETIDGLECVKIKAKVSGTVEGQGEQMGADFTFKGEVEGIDTWYFAYKEGLFVKVISDSSTEGTIDVSGPQYMTIPMTVELKTETKLIK